MNNDYEIIEKFREFASNDQGIELPENIVADGKLHRFRIEGEAKGKLSGAYKFHLDGRPAGFVQNFKTDAKANWKYTTPNYKKESITPEKIKAAAERKDAERKADVERKTQAAIQAWKEWNNTKLSDYNPYAERKGINLHNARVSEYKGEQQLIIPIQDKAGKFISLQRIKSDGTKRMFKDARKEGGFSILNKQQEPQIIAIAEGFATTASIIEDRYSVTNKIMGVMAIDAGNLKSVAEAMRELHPKAEILVFGDKGDLNDKGEKDAIEAARLVNGHSVMPPITKGDFNDYLTGKSGDITVSLENLINKSMGKVMANQQETELLEKIEAENKAEELGLSSIDFVKPDGDILVFKKEDSTWINKETEFTIQAELISDEVFKESAYKGMAQNTDVSKDYADTLPVETKQAIEKEAQQRASLESLDDLDKKLEVKANAPETPEAVQAVESEDVYQGEEIIKMEGQELYLNAEIEALAYTELDAKIALIALQDARHTGFNTYSKSGDETIGDDFLVSTDSKDEALKEAFVSGFMKAHAVAVSNNTSQFDSVENALNSRLSGFDIDIESLLKIAEKIKENEKELFEKHGFEHGNKSMPFIPARLIELEEISDKYVVNSIENTTVAGKVIESTSVEAEPIKAAENIQAQSTPAVGQTEPVKTTPETVASDHDPVKTVNDIPLPPMSDLSNFYPPEPDYSTMPAYDYDDSYDAAHLAAQETQLSRSEPQKSTDIDKDATYINHGSLAVPEVERVTPTPVNAEKVDISKLNIKAVEPEQKPEPLKPIPKDVADKYLQVEDKFYFRKNKNVVIFEDKGTKLETKLNSPSVAADLVRIAAERNWKEIKITGTPEFKSEVWMEAESRGIATTGYKPTDIDRAILKERLAKNPTNTIEEVKIQEKTNENPCVRQILDDSMNKKMAEQHLKSRPELKETFEYLEALKKQLEKSGASEKKIKIFMDTTKDGMAQMIDAGKYPEYQKTEHRQDVRQDKQPEPQKTQAQKEIVVTKTKTKAKGMEMEI